MSDSVFVANSRWVSRTLEIISDHLAPQRTIDVADLANRLGRVPWWNGCPRADHLYSGSSASRYRRVALNKRRSSEYSALLIGWPPGHATPIHDHDGLWGIEIVLDGVLEVETFAMTETPRLEIVSQGASVLGVGDHAEFSARDYAHQCRNLSAHRPALSLHVYGGELDRFSAYDRGVDGRWFGANHATSLEPALI